jgi:hypothetical protein
LIAERLALKDISKPVNGSIEEQLLMFFSDFATHARYHNLDALSAGQATYEDPLARWEGILIKVLEKDAPSKKLDLLKAQAHALSEAIADATSAIQHGMDGRLLTLEEILAAPQMHQIAAQYTMVRVFKVLTPLLDLLGHLGHEGFYGSPHSDGPYVPLYQEFFVWYSGTAAEIRRKKRWP